MKIALYAMTGWYALSALLTFPATVAFTVPVSAAWVVVLILGRLS